MKGCEQSLLISVKIAHQGSSLIRAQPHAQLHLDVDHKARPSQVMGVVTMHVLLIEDVQSSTKWHPTQTYQLGACSESPKTVLKLL